MSTAVGTAFWAHLAKPNQMSGKYQIDLGLLDTATIKSFKDNKISVKKDDKFPVGDEKYRGQYVTLKASEDYPPSIVDAKKQALPNTVLVGNGSKVRVVYNAFEWTFKGKSGVSAGLQAVQILDLIPYTGGGVTELEAEEGYVFGNDAEDNDHSGTVSDPDAELDDSVDEIVED